MMIQILMGCSKLAFACFQLQVPKKDLFLLMWLMAQVTIGLDQNNITMRNIVFVPCVSPQPGQLHVNTLI